MVILNVENLSSRYCHLFVIKWYSYQFIKWKQTYNLCFVKFTISYPKSTKVRIRVQVQMFLLETDIVFFFLFSWVSNMLDWECQHLFLVLLGGLLPHGILCLIIFGHPIQCHSRYMIHLCLHLSNRCFSDCNLRKSHILISTSVIE